MQKSISLVALAISGALPILGSLSLARANDVDFAHTIVPILKTHCSKCHAGRQKEGGFSINTREDLISGGDSGSPIELGKHSTSEIFLRVASNDDGYRMPPDGEKLTEEQIALIGKWIDQGAKWEAGYTFAPRTYDPPLRPRRPKLPPPQANRNHPIDRILDFDLSSRGQPAPAMVSDEVFLRRVSLDLIGLLPTPEQRTEFLNDPHPDKRVRLVDRLLSENISYADHWLTFWNDLLRNDYTGTGFITGGRTQITTWLYDSLVRNKPYDKMARELIAPPTLDSAGFINGIKWRGEVSAGQTVEIQFAQSVGQSFLGINLKCASCHDSFVDRWTLSEAFGLAAIYSERPLEIHRCDKPVGQTAEPKWLFPELGTVDPTLNKSQRLEQLANLLTHPENGRFTRTIVNRLWHRLMGHGIVHPTDAMQTEPWSEDLLDYLAIHLSDNQYDLKQTLRLIVTSAAYQSQSESVAENTDTATYIYRGPRAKKLTAEQFLDAIWQLTGAAPSAMDAQVNRIDPSQENAKTSSAVAQWIWNTTDSTNAPNGQTIAFRKAWSLAQSPRKVVAVISCDNEYTVYLDGRLIGDGKQWDSPNLFTLNDVTAGDHELIIVGRNGGNSPNPAGLWCEVRCLFPDQSESGFGTDASWGWSAQLPNDSGVYQESPRDWHAASVVNHGGVWSGRVTPQANVLLTKGIYGNDTMIRASLVKSDFLMRSLGRPNRDQIVSVRPTEMTTLEAIDLSIGETLDGYLNQGAERLVQKSWNTPSDLVRWAYQYALGREPTAEELDVLGSELSTPLKPSAVADMLWAIIMLPEFQINR